MTLARIWRRLGPSTQDVALAAAAALTAFGLGLWEGSTASPLLLAALSVTVAAPLIWRSRLPLTVATISVAVALWGLSAPGWSGGLIAAVACCSAVYHRPRRRGYVFTVSLACFVAPMFVGPAPSVAGSVTRVAGIGPTPFTQAILLGIAPVAVGYALRLHRERADQMARVHRAEALRVVAEERARTAREVHDAVGHHLTAIRMQASAARHVLGDAPPVADRALSTIGDSASSALTEIRALLAALRGPDGSVLADVRALADRLATPSCTITVTKDGPSSPLPALVDHGGYRLVQEALTNAVRHAEATQIHVGIRHNRQEVTITVDDNGPTQPPRDHSAEGYGIRGMRERVRLLGGTLEILPRQPHGWSIRAVLPISG
jgi:signal transduction histidine kinase